MAAVTATGQALSGRGASGGGGTALAVGAVALPWGALCLPAGLLAMAMPAVSLLLLAAGGLLGALLLYRVYTRVLVVSRRSAMLAAPALVLLSWALAATVNFLRY